MTLPWSPPGTSMCWNFIFCGFVFSNNCYADAE
jgi:hypothetical protein